MTTGSAAAALADRLRAISARPALPATDQLLATIERARAALASADPQRRPPASDGNPGGIIELDRQLPTMLLPDLHARSDLLLAALTYRPPGAVLEQLSIFQALQRSLVQVVCVGDGVHAEARAAQRWRDAMVEFRDGYRSHEQMDEEMRESFGAMEMVMELQCAFPDHFHFLKGNHDNIGNERGDGNLPFAKFAEEGAMVLAWVKQFCGEDLLHSYYAFEKQLPLLAIGATFLISHAEPLRLFERAAVLDYRAHPEVVLGLTWTDNDAAEPNAVEQMLGAYLHAEDGDEGDDGDSAAAYYFGGYRPVGGLYQTRADGHYVQFHNPGRLQAAFLPPDRPIDLDRDIFEL